jgi:hypothetical protein
MKRTLYSLLILFSAAGTSFGQQTTAMDFNRADCNGVQHHLFSTLDSNKVVIMEFFMLNCTPCITAGNKMKPMINSLNAAYPGHVQLYDIGFDDSYTCSDIADWVTTNNFNAFPMDSGGAMLAYYGGFGMPTVVIVGGANHEVLYTGIGFSTSDTTMMGSAVRNYFLANPLGVNDVSKEVSTHVYPNPTNDALNVSLTLNQPTDIDIELVDVTGRVVKHLFNGKTDNEFTKRFSTASLAAGMYFLRTTANGKSYQTKINLLR